MHWLMLRGLVREARHWGSFPETFAEHVRGARPLLLDLPGAGTEHRRPVPSSVAAMTDDLRARLFAVKPKGEPCAILAVSLGGMIALDWAARYPQDFERVVVINTSAAEVGLPWERFRLAQIPRVLRSLASPKERERNVLAMTSRSSTIDKEALAAEWARYALERPIAHRAFLRQLYAASRSRLPSALATKALVLSSQGDELVSPACSDRLADRLGLPIRRHAWAGHDLPLDDPEWVAGQVQSWLEEGELSAAV